jgi:MoaA/NifB/PqqE/SkfB family radical SAM enzyme/protein-L-isoaspartate O-methyltransferase
MRGDEFFAEVAHRPPFTKLHPQVAAFFKDYLASEKAVRFGGRFVVNTNFPPFPSRAFENLAEGFRSLGDAGQRRLFSVTLAVTNRCTYDCWHCYNAGRSQEDLSLRTWKNVAAELQEMGAVMVTFTGGEPLLRNDLDEIVALFDERSCLVLGTTGAGLTAERARRLRDGGLFAVGISLDSTDRREHDRLRGHNGAFRTAVDALQIAGQAGLYPYVVAVATREFLRRGRFMRFMRFAAQCGALEVHLLEPGAVGKLAGRTDVLLTAAESRMILDYQREVAEDDQLPILSSYAYLEASEAFGCGAGLTHLYIDGSGEVYPCQMVPLSFGNVGREPLARILHSMGNHFRQPRARCVGRLLTGHVADGQRPTTGEKSAEVCRGCLPASHELPRFFQIRSQAQEEVGRNELKAAYDRVHHDYDDFWLSKAAGPIDDLVRKLPRDGTQNVFEAGCGTGYATALLADGAQRVLAVDISKRMLVEARRRLRAKAVENVRLAAGDALEVLEEEGPFDLVFSSWVLGYIPLKPFFAAAASSLSGGGRLAFVVHKENSPRRPLEIFAELVARDPTVLRKRVAFDFPRDAQHVEAEMSAAGLRINQLWEGAVVFRYDSPEEVLEHLLKSGAGTAFYDAVDPARRQSLTDEFLRLLADRRQSSTGYQVAHDSGYQVAHDSGYQVAHDYVACIAEKP